MPLSMKIISVLLLVSLSAAQLDPNSLYSTIWNNVGDDIFTGRNHNPTNFKIFGPNIFPLLADINTNSIKIAGVAFQYENAGKVILLGSHHWLKDDITPSLTQWNANMANFVSNGKSGAKFVSVAMTPTMYTKSGYTLVKSVNTMEELFPLLSQIDFIIINLSWVPKWVATKEQISQLKAYLRSGKGLILGCKAWTSHTSTDILLPSLLFWDKGLLMNTFGEDAIWGQIVKITSKTDKYSFYSQVKRFLDLAKKNQLKENAEDFDQMFKTYNIWEINEAITRILSESDKLNYLVLEKQLLPFYTSLVEIWELYKTPITFPTSNDTLLKSLVVLIDYINGFNGLPRYQNPQILAAEKFPGKGDGGESYLSLVEKTYTINVNTDRTDWFSTGLYVVPGGSLTITLDKLVDANLKIGCHKDSLRKKPTFLRFPQIVFSTLFSRPTVSLFAYNGGLIYFDLKKTPSSFTATITGQVIKAPYFNQQIHKNSDWQLIKNNPGPWAEIEANGFIFSIQSKFARNIQDPESIAAFWSYVLPQYFNFYSSRPRTYKERFVVDIDIGGGYMHSGYPMMAYLDQNEPLSVVPRPAAEENTRFDYWGEFHEIGHNFQRSEFTPNGMGEVSNNWMALYMAEQFPPVGREDGRDPKSSTYAERRELLKKPAPNNLIDFGNFYQYFWFDVRQAFGWPVFKAVLAEYPKMDPKNLPKTDLEKQDFFLIQFSTRVKRNIYPHFAAYGCPVSEAARLAVEQLGLPKWDRMKFIDYDTSYLPGAVPSVSLYIDNTKAGQSSTYRIKFVTWFHIYVKQNFRMRFKFKGAVPSNPKGLEDKNFALGLNGKSLEYINPVAIYSTVNGVPMIDVSFLKFVPTDTGLEISFVLTNNSNAGQVVDLIPIIIDKNGYSRGFGEKDDRTLENPRVLS